MSHWHLCSAQQDNRSESLKQLNPRSQKMVNNIKQGSLAEMEITSASKTTHPLSGSKILVIRSIDLYLKLYITPLCFSAPFLDRFLITHRSLPVYHLKCHLAAPKRNQKQRRQWSCRLLLCHTSLWPIAPWYGRAVDRINNRPDLLRRQLLPLYSVLSVSRG
jgi:hypothetical protein